jgi:hypothetical protein
MPGQGQNYFLLLSNLLRSLSVRGSRLEVPKIGTEVTLQEGVAEEIHLSVIDCKKKNADFATRAKGVASA